jgi:hypothetical protein
MLEVFYHKSSSGLTAFSLGFCLLLKSRLSPQIASKTFCQLSLFTIPIFFLRAYRISVREKEDVIGRKNDFLKINVVKLYLTSILNFHIQWFEFGLNQWFGA